MDLNVSGDYTNIGDVILDNEVNPSQPICPFYINREPLGKGSQGAIYLATRGGEAFALKVSIKATMMSSKLNIFPSLNWFNPIELDIMKRLNHPNLARAIELIHPELCGLNALGILMDLADGNLSTLAMEISRRTDFNDKFSLFYEIAEGVHYMHRNGFVHCDIKPDNILVRRITISPRLMKYRLILTDFGLSGTLSYEIDAYNRNGTGNLVVLMKGTPFYLPLEILNYEQYVKYASIVRERRNLPGIEPILNHKEKGFTAYRYNELIDVWGLGLSMLLLFRLGNMNQEIIPSSIMTPAELERFLIENFLTGFDRNIILSKFLDPKNEFYDKDGKSIHGELTESVRTSIPANILSQILFIRKTKFIFMGMLDGLNSQRYDMKKILTLLNKKEIIFPVGHSENRFFEIDIDTIPQSFVDYIRVIFLSLPQKFSLYTIKNLSAKFLFYTMDLICDFFLIGAMKKFSSPIEFIQSIGSQSTNIDVVNAILFISWRYFYRNSVFKGFISSNSIPDNENITRILMNRYSDPDFHSFFINFIITLDGKFGDFRFRELLINTNKNDQELYDLFVEDPLYKYRLQENKQISLVSSMGGTSGVSLIHYSGASAAAAAVGSTAAAATTETTEIRQTHPDLKISDIRVDPNRVKEPSLYYR